MSVPRSFIPAVQLVTKPRDKPINATTAARVLRVDRSSGRVSVAYKDSRNDPTRAGADVYMRQSVDGGASWEPALRLSSATSRARVVPSIESLIRRSPAPAPPAGSRCPPRC